MQQVAEVFEARQSFSVFFFTSGRLWQEFRESLGSSEAPWNITSLCKKEKKMIGCCENVMDRKKDRKNLNAKNFQNNVRKPVAKL